MELNKEEFSRLLKVHMSSVLGIIGALLGLIVLLFFVWGIMLLVRSVGDASGFPAQGVGNGKFNLEDARKLNLRGLE